MSSATFRFLDADVSKFFSWLKSWMANIHLWSWSKIWRQMSRTRFFLAHQMNYEYNILSQMLASLTSPMFLSF